MLCRRRRVVVSEAKESGYGGSACFERSTIQVNRVLIGLIFKGNCAPLWRWKFCSQCKNLFVYHLEKLITHWFPSYYEPKNKTHKVNLVLLSKLQIQNSTIFQTVEQQLRAKKTINRLFMTNPTITTKQPLLSHSGHDDGASSISSMQWRWY